jgi:hypothetical protein
MKGVTCDVVEALRTLLAVDVIPRVRALEPAALTPANAVRRGHVYTKATSTTLQNHSGALRMIFDGYSTSRASVPRLSGSGRLLTGKDGGRLEHGHDANLLGLDEWCVT